jgi:hypothetical protein
MDRIIVYGLETTMYLILLVNICLITYFISVSLIEKDHDNLFRGKCAFGSLFIYMFLGAMWGMSHDSGRPLLAFFDWVFMLVDLFYILGFHILLSPPRQTQKRLPV